MAKSVPKKYGVAVVLGAGITGLRCGQKLSKNKKIVIIEKKGNIGGLAASFNYKNFIFDIGPHKMYSIVPEIMNEYKEILGNELLINKKRNSIYLMNHYYKFPISPLQFVKHFNKLVAVKCGLSYMSTFLKRKSPEKIISYKDYFVNGFGKEAYKLFFKGIAKKAWGDPKKLSADLAARRVSAPNILKIIKGILTKKNSHEVSASEFYYPKYGIGTICEKLRDGINQNKGKIYTQSFPTKISIKGNNVDSLLFDTNGKEQEISKPENLISTIHLVDLIKIIEPKPKKDVLDAVKELKFRSIVIMYLIINKPKILEDHWVFFLEEKYIFTRIAEPKNFSSWTSPKKKSSITVEVPCEFQGPIYKLPEEKLFERVIAQLEEVGIIKKNEVEEYFSIKINRCYPIYDLSYKENLTKVLDYIDLIDNMFTIGRQGLYNYNNTDHSIDMANKLANHILLKKPKKEWLKTRRYFDEYRIID